MQRNRSGSGDKNFCTPFSSARVPANIPCPVVGGPMDLLSRPPPSAELGHRQRRNGRLHMVAKAAPQDTQSELALSEQHLLGGRRKRHWVSQAFSGPCQPPSKSCSLCPNFSLDCRSQRSHWSIQDTALHSFPFMTTPFSHSDPTPGQLQLHNPRGLPVRGQPAGGPTNTHLQTSQQAAPGGLVVSVFPPAPSSASKGIPKPFSQAGSSQHGVEEAESPQCCWGWSHTGTTAGSRASLTTCYENTVNKWNVLFSLTTIWQVLTDRLDTNVQTAQAAQTVQPWWLLCPTQLLQGTGWAFPSGPSKDCFFSSFMLILCSLWVGGGARGPSVSDHAFISRVNWAG